MAKPPLVAIGYYAAGTGMTRVLRHILAALEDQFEIHYVGLVADGPPRQDGAWRVYPAGREGRDIFGVYLAEELIKRLYPALVLVHQDIWYLDRYIEQLRPALGTAGRLIGYIPIDGEVTDERLAAPLAELDTAVVYTQFARREIEHAWQRLGIRGNLRVIGHGVDLSAFYPLPDRIAAKREIFPRLADPEHAFIVLNASRPAPRKRVDITLEGFAQFAQGKPPGVKLCLHQAISRDNDAESMRSLADRFGIRDRLLFDAQAHLHGPLDEDRLNLLYNACDVGLNTSLGEGWGLVSFEHAAAGAAQIVPRHTALTELWEGAAELVDPIRSYIPPVSLLRMSEVAPTGVAAALERLYSSPQLLAQRATEARERATSPEFRWSSMDALWRSAASAANAV